MKKIISGIVLAISLVGLAACTNDTKTESTASTTQSTSMSEATEQQATITIQEDGKDISSKTIEFKDGESVYDALKNNFSIEDKDGFITKIDGKEQDQSANKYWMYTINGEDASKGAKDIQLKAGDKIIFNLSAM